LNEWRVLVLVWKEGATVQWWNYERGKRKKTWEMLVSLGLRSETLGEGEGMDTWVDEWREDIGDRIDVKIEVAGAEGGECENDGEGDLGMYW
jgi:hypothetical protein